MTKRTQPTSPLTQQISKILAQHDHEGLLKLGAPSDEYATEAEDIAEILPAARSAEELETLIALVFVERFYTLHKDEAGDMPTLAAKYPARHFKEAAEAIWTLQHPAP